MRAPVSGDGDVGRALAAPGAVRRASRRPRRPRPGAAAATCAPRRGPGRCALEVGVVAAARASRQHHLVEVAVDGGDRVRQPGAGSASSWKTGEPGRSCRISGVGTTCAQSEPWCGVPRVTSDCHPPVAALSLHVVPGDQAAEAVPHHVHAVVAGLLADALDVRAEIGGPRGDVGAQRAVVPGADLGEAAPPEVALHDGEDRAVVDEAVHQEDRGPRRKGVGGEQGPAARGWSPGRIRGSGRSASVRVPSGYIST